MSTLTNQKFVREIKRRNRKQRRLEYIASMPSWLWFGIAAIALLLIIKPVPDCHDTQHKHQSKGATTCTQ